MTKGYKKVDVDNVLLLFMICLDDRKHVDQFGASYTNYHRDILRRCKFV